ncbi:MAG: rhomboid family intramembrane serine protease [Bacteroidota bacterium]
MMNHSMIEEFQMAWKRPNNITFRLIAVNIGMFVFLGVASLLGTTETAGKVNEFIQSLFYLSPDAKVFLLRPWTFFTYGFTHKGLLEILFNMLILYWFSILLKNSLGSIRVLAVYLYGALAAGLFFVLGVALSSSAAAVAEPFAGARGAVYAIMVATATLHPDQKMNLFFIGEVKLKWIVAVYVGLSLLVFLGNNNTVLNGAHLGGAAMGFLFIKQYQNQIDWSTPLVRLIDWFEGLAENEPPAPKAKRSKVKSTAGSAAKGKQKAQTKSSDGTISQEEVDRILDKISESGYEKLTKEEKQILFRASQSKK